MKESLSAWQMVFKGIKWGCLIVILTGLVAPLLDEIEAAIVNLSGGHNLPIPIGSLEGWLLSSIITMVVFAIPGVIGGGGLGLLLFFWLRQGSLSHIASILSGALTGLVVAVVNGLSFHVFFISATAKFHPTPSGRIKWALLRAHCQRGQVYATSQR